MTHGNLGAVLDMVAEVTDKLEALVSKKSDGRLIEVGRKFRKAGGEAYIIWNVSRPKELLNLPLYLNEPLTSGTNQA